MSARLSRSTASAAASCCRSFHASIVARSSSRTGAEARTLFQHRVATPAAAAAAAAANLQSPTLLRTYATTTTSSYAVPPPQSKKADTESATSASQAPISDISKQGFSDKPLPVAQSYPSPGSSSSSSSPQDSTSAESQVDWTRSYHGLSTEPFSPEAAAILQAPLEADDVEIKPDGIIYLPEIKYRRILNKAFGPGGWGLAPRGETIVTGKAVTREYALVVLGRLVSIARGEQDYFSADGIPTATEGCRSNALLRCCKDLGVASELWDPRFIRDFMKRHVREVWVEHVTTKKKKKIFVRKDAAVVYPFKETKA